MPVYNEKINRLNLLWDPKKPVDFNSEVNYACAGFSERNDTFFEHDRDLEFFSVPCQDDGFFKPPDEWFKCLKGKYCRSGLYMNYRTIVIVKKLINAYIRSCLF